MSDITICSGAGCPLKDRCYRHRVVVHGRFDSFGATVPYDAAKGTCDRFMDLAARAPSEQNIRDRAYALWQAEGRPEGRADDHWAAARAALEKSFLGELRPVSAS